MSSVLKSLFGGSDTKQQSTSTTSNYTDPTLQGLSPDLANTLRTLLGSYSGQASGAGNPVGNATPTTQAPLTAQEQSLLNSSALSAPGADASAYIKDVLGGKYLPGQPGANPFLDAAIRAAQRPTLEGLEQTLTRSLPGRFTQAGQFVQPQSSSAFDYAAALASRGAANTLGDIATNISSNAYTTERQHQDVAAGLDQAQVDTTIKALQASALPRLIQQNGLDQGLALFQEQTKNLLDLLKSIGAISAPTLGTNSQSTGTSSTEKGIIPALFPKGLFGGGN